MEKLVQLDHIAGLKYGIANYRKKEKFERIFEEYKKDVLRDKDFQPLKNFEMQLYGKNRLATLRFAIVSPPDPRVKGKPALYYLYDGGDRINVHFLSLYFFLPKGKPLTVDNLQIL